MLDPELQQTLFQQLSTDNAAHSWQLTGRVLEARECRIYQARNSETGQHVAIKQYHQPRHNLSRHFQQLLTLAARMHRASPRYRIAKPLAYWTEKRIICMEWLEAETLDQHLWKWFFHRQRQQQAMRYSLEWLKHYHLQSDWQVKPLASHRYPHQLQQIIDTHPATPQPLQDDTDFQAGYETLQSHQNTFRDQPAPHALVHGDFTPSNIMLNQQATYGIDIGHGASQPVMNDLTSMLTYIAVGYPNMLTRGDMQHPLPDWPLPLILLRAYEPDSTKWPDPHYFTYVFLYQILKRWFIINQRCHQQQTRWLDRWRLYKFRQICRALCTELQTDTRPAWHHA